MNSWRGATKKQYQVYFKKWEKYCDTHNVNLHCANINHVVEFLTALFQSGLSYSALNTARSALSSFIILSDNNSSYTVGNHPTVKRLLRGMFNYRPSLPRYTEIWDVSIVLRYLKTLTPGEQLDLKTLTRKLAMLLALLSAQRVQTLQYLNINHMSLAEDKVVFYIHKCVKQTRPGFHTEPLVFQKYVADESLCVLTTLNLYLKKTVSIRGDYKALFISAQRPHRPVSVSTISKWIKDVLILAGIDVKQFSSHSTRAASVSAANKNGLPLQDIMSAAGWSSAGTFQKFYNKVSNLQNKIADSVLDTCI